MDILEVLKILDTLQLSDREFIKIKRERMRIEKQISDEAGLERLRKVLEIAKANTLNAKLNLAHIKSEIATNMDQNSQLEKRLYDGSITSTRELKSVESEQAELRRKITRDQEKVGPHELNIAQLDKKEKEASEKLAQSELEWTDAKPRYKQQVSEYNEQLLELSKKRKQYTDQLSKEHVVLYTKLFKETKGRAVVKVSRGICLGCNILLPLNEVDADKNSGNLPRCSNCARILVSD